MPRTKQFDEEQVLEKAVELFWRQGYHATSIQDVVDNLSINRASLYDTYGDKRTLYIKSLKRYRTDETQAIVRLLQAPGNALDKIRNLLEQRVQAILSDGAHRGCFIVNTAVELVNHDAEIARIAFDNQQEVEMALRQIIREGQAAGQITTRHDAVALAQYLVSNFNGLQVMGKINPDKNVLENIARITLETLTSR